jgi:hypothetical protein
MSDPNISKDGDFSSPFAGVRNFEPCVPGTPATGQMFTEDYTVDMDTVSAPPFPLMDSPHPSFPDYYLVDVGPQQDMGANLKRYTLTYSQVPGNYNETAEYTIEYPGFYWDWFSDNRVKEHLAPPAFRRPAFTQSVPGIVQIQFVHTNSPWTISIPPTFIGSLKNLALTGVCYGLTYDYSITHPEYSTSTDPGAGTVTYISGFYTTPVYTYYSYGFANIVGTVGVGTGYAPGIRVTNPNLLLGPDGTTITAFTATADVGKMQGTVPDPVSYLGQTYDLTFAGLGVTAGWMPHPTTPGKIERWKGQIWKVTVIWVPKL